MKGLIIGFGNMGQLHYHRYLQLGATISAVIDSEPTKRQQADALGLKSYASLADYLEGNEPDQFDFVDICLPTHLHFAMIKEIVERFSKCPIPICVEKPVVRTITEAQDLEKLLGNYHQLVFVAECEHYNTRLTDFLASIRKPSHIEITRSVNLEYFLKGSRPWFLDPELSGGIVLDLMIHDFSLLDSVGGRASIKDARFKCVHFQCIDEVSVELEYAGFTATLSGSWLSTNKDNPIVTTIHVIDDNSFHHQLIVSDYMDKNENDPYLLELKSFLSAIETRRPPHSLTEYLRVVCLANEVMAKAPDKQVSPPSVFFNPERDTAITNTTSVPSAKFI